MPASLYRLAGKPHPTEAPTVKVEPVVAPVTVETIVAVEPVVVVPDVIEQVVESIPEPVVQVDSTPEVVEVQKVVWEPTWTRSKLYQVATEAGLTVDSTMSKASIINLLSSL
jgi:hypothetical protein